MKKLFLIPLTTVIALLIISCKENVTNISTIIPTTTNYDLNGNVRSLIEKTFSAIYDENGNIIADNTDPLSSSIKREFNNNKNIISSEYFDWNNSLTSRSEYYEGYLIDFDKNGIKESYYEVVSENGNILSKLFDIDSKEKLSESWTKYENGHMVRQYSISNQYNYYIEYNFFRNNDGLDTLKRIKAKYYHIEDTIFSEMNIKYLDFDDKDNWIKKIEIPKDSSNSFIVRQREIMYY